MTSHSVIVILFCPLLLTCSQPEPATSRAAGAGQVPDSSMTRLPVDHWGNQLISSSPSERKAALGYLAYYGAAAAPYIPAIVQDLSGQDDSLGFTAAWSLAHIGAAAFPALAQALESNDAAVRRRAAYGLGEAGAAVAGSAVPKLDSLSRGDPVAAVRDMAKWASDQVNQRQIGDPNLGMTEGLNSGNLEVRLEAIRRLGAVPAWNRAAIAELIRQLGDTSDVVHRSAIDALVQKGKAALPMLTAALAHPRDRVRSAATAAITRIHGQL